MLSEWIEIYPILKELGCDLGESHPSFKPCPNNKKTFRVYIDKNGHVEDIDIPQLDMGKILRWQEGKKDPAFPVINARALLEVSNESNIPDWITGVLKNKDFERKNTSETSHPDNTGKEKVSIDELALNNFINECNDLWKTELPWIKRCFNEVPAKLLKMLEINPDKPGGYKAFLSLVERVSLIEPVVFRDEIQKILLQKLMKTMQKDYAEALFAFKKPGRKKGRGSEHQKDFLYLLTINDYNKLEFGDNSYPPYHETLQSWMARTFEIYSNKTSLPTGKNDAFRNDMAGAQDNFDDINTGLGQIKLFSANKDIPCLKRYGLISSDLFPAGRASREIARKTLSYILHRDREGITWRSLKKYDNRNSIAFAYCTRLKDSTIIKVFDNDEESAEDNIYISEESTRAALKVFEGVAEHEPAAEIVIGIVTAVDKGNSKVQVSRRYPLKKCLDCAARWQSACANTPDLKLPWIIRQNRRKGGTGISGKPFGDEIIIKGTLPVYPTRAIWLLNSAWKQNGEMIIRKQGNQKVPVSKRFISSDALDLLFEENENLTDRVDIGLADLIENSAYALINARRKAELSQCKQSGDSDFKDSEYLHMIPTLYGLLLYKKGIKKEDYMNDGVFSLGKLFAAVDRLHIYYSLKERKGDIPGRLLGNDHMSLALQNPQEAFVTLGQRLIHPYISWAKRFQIEQDDKESELGKQVRWCLWDITNLNQLLSGEDLPAEINNTDKAKLILGYLSYGAQTKS